MNVGYADFVLLCQVNDPDTWDDALSVRKDGVYVKPLTDDCTISPEERAVLAQHPSGNLNDPALRFPCTLDDLQRFLEEHGAYGCIDAFRMARWVQAARNNGQAWRQRLAAAEYLEHGEAAGALAGVDWSDVHAPLSTQGRAEWRGWFKNIEQAIRSGSLRAFHGDIDKDGNEGPLLISPSEFKAWCESKGLGDPFSLDRPSFEDQLPAAREPLDKLDLVQSQQEGHPTETEPAPSNGSHVSDRLALLNQAARRWWANADRHDPATHPGNADVASWLIEKGMTKSLAERAASIIRPEWAHTGRKPDA